jgi:hypothetical protein
MMQDGHVTLIHECHGKSSIQKGEDFFFGKLDLNLSNNLLKCYIWSKALCGAET